MKKKISVFVMVFCIGTLLIGCSVKEKLHQQTGSVEEISDKEREKAIKEEQEHFENQPRFACSSKEIFDNLLEQCIFLKEKEDKGYYTLISKKGTISIITGEKKEDKITSVAIESTENDILKDKELKNEILSIIQVVVETLGEEYQGEKELLEEIESMDIEDQIDEYSFSENISLFLGREKSYFIIRIKPK